MGGGSYSYAYSRLDEISHWASIFEDMAEECEKAAVETQTKRVESVPGSHTLDKDVPITLEERARLMVKALRLKRVGKMLRQASLAASELESVMHDVEWASSCDYSWSQLMEPEE